MKPSRNPVKNSSRAAGLLCGCLAVAVLIWTSPPAVFGQVIPTTPVPGQTNTPSTGPGLTNSTNADKTATSDEIQVSFQGANIDMIVQWLAQTTGKSVLKHPRVQTQVTIVSSKKVSPREAVALVYRALALEGFVAIESGKSILIFPEGSEPKLTPDFLDASQVEVPSGRQKLTKIFPLKFVSATDMKEKIKGLLSEKATIDVDDHANQLIITDFNDNIGVAGNFIKAMDTDKAADVAVRVIPLKHVSAQDLAREVGPIYQKMSGKSPKEIIEVSANDRSNSLIVRSSEANFKGVETLVAALDTEDALEKTMQAFPLKNADASDVAKQLKDLNADQDANTRSPYYYIYGGGSSSGRNKKSLSVIADRRRNTVVVQAPPAAMEGIAKMIATLDEPVTDDSLAPRIYPMKYVNAVDIEDVLNELFLKKTQQRNYFSYFGDPEETTTSDRDVGRLYGKVRITSEPYSNAIILSSNSKENLAAVEEILKQLDVPSQAGESTFRVALRFAKSSAVANSINVLFAKVGSPPLRPVAQPGQQNVQNQQQQQQQQANQFQSSFRLEQETKEDGYFPWLGGQPENTRTADGRNAARPVSDLVGKVRVVADQRSNSLLISANVHFFPQVIRLIEELDVPTAQVLIEARIVEVASDYLDKLGVRWSPDGSQVFTASDYDNSFLVNTRARYTKGFGGNTVVNTPSFSDVSSALTTIRSGVLASTINVDFLIQFLKQTTDASVLAEPQINIADNESGKIFVGQQIPFINNTLTTDVGGQNNSFVYRDVGVILEVTPHINTSGDVALRIHAESSAVVPGQTILGGAIIDTRNFKTDLTAKDGQTLVLGGIIQRQIADTLRKTPILGSIPGVKWLFNKKDKTSREVELMVFLRPRVVRTPEEAREMLNDVDKKLPKLKDWREGIPPSKNDERDQKPKDGK